MLLAVSSFPECGRCSVRATTLPKYVREYCLEQSTSFIEFPFGSIRTGHIDPLLNVSKILIVNLFSSISIIFKFQTRCALFDDDLCMDKSSSSESAFNFAGIDEHDGPYALSPLHRLSLRANVSIISAHSI